MLVLGMLALGVLVLKVLVLGVLPHEVLGVTVTATVAVVAAAAAAIVVAACVSTSPSRDFYPSLDRPPPVFLHVHICFLLCLLTQILPLIVGSVVPLVLAPCLPCPVSVLRSSVLIPLVLHQPIFSRCLLRRPLLSPLFYPLVFSISLALIMTFPPSLLAPLLLLRPSVSTLVVAVADLASIHRLDYATQLVSVPARPLSIKGVPLGTEVQEDMQYEMAFLAAAAPHLCAMLLAPKGDLDALDIPTPRTYAGKFWEPWAFLWTAAMDEEMAS
ncbi:unnamed protein product [Closterium sp. NIES-54]